MGTAGSEALGPPAPVDADIAAVTDRVKIFEAKLGFGTDAFTSTDFEGAVFLRSGDPTDIFILSAKNSLKSATHKFIKQFHKTIIVQRNIAIQITVYFNA